MPKNHHVNKKCGECIRLINRKSDDIMYGVRHSADELYFVITDPDWFDRLIKKKKDGLAIDIIAKEQYQCGSPNKLGHHYTRGFVLPPIFKKEIDQRSTYTVEGHLLFKVGAIPPHFFGREIEFNTIVIQNGHYCHYLRSHLISGHKWEILETGLFVDTLSELSVLDKAIVLNKRFQFEIPFEKNKYEYNASDIQPIYDSLNLYNYRIKSIEIEAYSSLEGDKRHNEWLQKKRAQSIVNIFESFQKEPIPLLVKTSENWVDFFNDIEGTPYAGWRTFNKSTIKEKLRDHETLERLEPIFSNHRKGILYLELEKKIHLKFRDQEELIHLFGQAIRTKDVPYALDIQRSAYHYIQNDIFPQDLINQLEVPLEREFALLYNNRIVYQYRQSSNLQMAISEFRKLLEIVPDNAEVLYNVYALSLRSWSLGFLSMDKKELLDGIKSLGSNGLNPALSNRLLINYYILHSEEYQLHRKYKLKDDLIRKTYKIYKNIPLSPNDALSIAKYFVGYQKYDWAISILTPYINDISAPEDLLFFYINLTIVKPHMVRKAGYRTLLMNAINKNKTRFCALFNPIMYGGISFQLLENDYLKRIYCEHCSPI